MKIYEKSFITIFQSCLYQTNSILLHFEHSVLLVDPCYFPHELVEIKKHIPENKKLYIVFTHSDYDHIIGYKLFENATIITSEYLTQKSLEEQSSILEQMIEFDDMYYIERGYPIEYPIADILIPSNGLSLLIDGFTINFFQTPGHTKDGIGLYCKELGVLIPGDYLSDLEFPFIYDSSKSYLETLDRFNDLLEASFLKMMIPGHGNFTEEVEEIRRRCKVGQTYIQDLLKNSNPTTDWVKKYKFTGALAKCHAENIEKIAYEKQQSSPC